MARRSITRLTTRSVDARRVADKDTVFRDRDLGINDVMDGIPGKLRHCRSLEADAPGQGLVRL